MNAYWERLTCPCASCLINYSDISCYRFILTVAGECVGQLPSPILYETHTKLRSKFLKRFIVQKVGRQHSRLARKQLLYDLKEKRRSWNLKEEALDRTVWSTRFVTGFGPVATQAT
jgi:hypothetical protein